MVVVGKGGAVFQRLLPTYGIASTFIPHLTPTQPRNLPRMIWVHVAVPLMVATGSTPSKIPISQLTHAELRHQKIELCGTVLALSML